MPLTVSSPWPLSTASSTEYKAMDAASLNRLSPSTSVVSRLGAPTSRKMPTTATGSVVATMAPSSRQTTRP
ncbi:hypothetical protein G6F59_015636 [Rhizopus arrhizus]|nr:hypothetical protein G6F23_014495 [Rhizopus arrhizus]KAG1389230.1 hypothetical protein G6F59_015636 [Rhizopus arrhizus]